MCLFTTPKGIKIGQPSQEKSGVLKSQETVNRPVVKVAIGSSSPQGRLGISTRVCILIRHKVFLKGISLLFFLSHINLRLIIMTYNKFFGTLVK